jgi:hypothetical protein
VPLATWLKFSKIFEKMKNCCINTVTKNLKKILDNVFENVEPNNIFELSKNFHKIENFHTNSFMTGSD